VKKLPPFYPSNFTAADARLLADEGFNVARIGFIWEGVEPSPGQFDGDYIARIAALDSLLRRYGIRTFVDFHQDGWSRSLGFDGAPDWATLDPTILGSFAAFWRDDPAPDGMGIQSHFLAAWGRAAQVLRRHVNVIGFDPFNEPYPGSDYGSPCGPFSPCPAFEAGPLASFYQRAIATIRAAGARQVIWPEGIAQNGQQSPALPSFADAQTAFTFHYYCPLTQLSSDRVPVGEPNAATTACAPLEQAGVGTFLIYAASLGVPSLLSEFSCHDVNPDNAQVVDLVGREFTSWTIWAYYRNVPDPANCPNQGLLEDEGQPASEANAKQDKLDALAVPYAQAIAGTPMTTNLDRSTRTFTLSYRSAAVQGAQLSKRARTVVFIPERMYPDGYVVDVSGARVVSRRDARRLKLQAEPDHDVSVTVTPRS
jgi:endoglycosylceramidase